MRRIEGRILGDGQTITVQQEKYTTEKQNSPRTTWPVVSRPVIRTFLSHSQLYYIIYDTKKCCGNSKNHDGNFHSEA
jgi:hypothetical protein